MNRLLYTLVALLLTFVASAQPTQVGCHYYRNRLEKPKKLSAAQQKALEASIQRADTLDILHYDIDIDVTDYNGNFIRAATTVTFSALEPDRESIILDLYQLQVDSVSDSNGPLLFSYDGALLQVYFADPPLVGEAQSFTVFYQGNPHQDPSWGGFYFQSDYIYNLGIGLTTVPPNFGKVWYPCFDIFVERATYTYHVTSSNGKVASCQGELVEEVLLGGDTIRRTFEFPQTIPTYLSAIAVADYESTDYIHEGFYGDVPVRLTSKQEHQGGMNTIFQQLEYGIDACEHWWGPNPFSRVGYVLTTDGALEIPTNIAYPQFMLNESLNSNGELFSHELGHYWWGDMITMIEHNDMWIKEGPAEYSSFLFYEWRDGWDEFVEVIKDNQLFVLQECHLQDNGYHALSPMPDEEIYGRTTYQKGASVLHNLRAYLGDELFRDGMMAMQQNMPYSNVDAYGFRDSLSAYTGFDLTDFFDDQIFSPGFSVFVIDSVNTVNNGGVFTHTLYIQQKLHACQTFYDNVPLEVTALNEAWEKEDFMVIAGEQFSTVQIETSYLPALIELNTNGRLNQARLDTEFIIDGTSGPINRPFVDFRLGTNEINEGDSAWVRIEHIWAAPDNNNLADYIEEISTTHYWKVSGVFPELIEMDGRLGYDGAEPEDLDYDLYGFNENDAMLVWRPDASHPWIMYGDYELQAGNLMNGTGQIVIEPLRPGQYAFANGDVAAAIAQQEATASIKAWPIPADYELTVKLPENMASQGVRIELIDLSGRMVLQESSAESTGTITLDIGSLPAGSYTLVARSNGLVLNEKIEIRR